jgi:hypothetical protein
MTEKRSMMVFIFENSETGDFEPIDASNESAARLELGGIWIDIELTKIWASCRVADLSSLSEQVLGDLSAALHAKVSANPAQTGGFVSTGDLADFSAKQARYSQLKTLREKLSRIVAAQ